MAQAIQRLTELVGATPRSWPPPMPADPSGVTNAGETAGMPPAPLSRSAPNTSRRIETPRQGSTASPRARSGSSRGGASTARGGLPASASAAAAPGALPATEDIRGGTPGGKTGWGRVKASLASPLAGMSSAGSSGASIRDGDAARGRWFRCRARHAAAVREQARHQAAVQVASSMPEGLDIFPFIYGNYVHIW